MPRIDKPPPPHPGDTDTGSAASRPSQPVYNILAQKTRHLRIINDLAIELLRVDSLNDVLWLITRGAIANLGFDDCIIYLVDDTSRQLVQRAAHGPKNPAEREIRDPIVIPVGEGIVGAVAVSGEPVIVRDTREDSRYIVDDASRLSEIAVPILHHERVIGVIDSENENPHFYTEEHLEVLTILASITSTKLAACLSIESLNETVKRLEETRVELQRREAELESLATRDALTQLLNRRELMRRGERLLERARAVGARSALWYVDLDQFRLVNNRFGHNVGDFLLTEVAGTISDEIGSEGVVTRVGGDEFVILLPNREAESSQAACDRLIRRVARQSYAFGGRRIATRLSVGIAEINADSPSLSSVIDAADKANYIAKRHGRNQYHLASPVDDSYRLQVGLTERAVEVSAALEGGQLVIYVQPIFELGGNRRSVALECLLRLRRDDGETVPAAEFIEACEHFSQMHLIDRWVIPRVLAWVRRHAARRRLPTISINVSSASIDDPTFADYLLDEIRRHRIDTRRTGICIEITETSAISNLQQAGSLLTTLREHHVQTALDDFGNGYASFALLKQLMVDVVKIDKLFIETLDTPVDRKIVSSINDVAHEIGAITVAEGVETEHALCLLREIGVDHVQGFLLGRPLPMDALYADMPGEDGLTDREVTPPTS